MKKIVLTGGGTAGHVTPNIALIPALKDAGYDISYIGSYDGIEKKLIQDFDIPYTGIATGKFRRYLDVKNLTDPFRVIKGFAEARKYLKELKPDVVFSKGGFVSVPVVRAAASLKIPCIIHESDMTPGLANKLCIPVAHKVCCNFPETLNHLPKEKAVLTGSPIRQELLTGDRGAALKFCGLSADKPVILIIGGSLGSVVVNNAVRKILPELLKNFQVIHLCGKDKVDVSLKDLKGYVQFEYIQDELKDLFALADIVISRAGANAICELLALHKPNLLIPLSANASRGDQILNARSFERQGYSHSDDPLETRQNKLTEHFGRHEQIQLRSKVITKEHHIRTVTQTGKELFIGCHIPVNQTLRNSLNDLRLFIHLDEIVLHAEEVRYLVEEAAPHTGKDHFILELIDFGVNIRKITVFSVRPGISFHFRNGFGICKAAFGGQGLSGRKTVVRINRRLPFRMFISPVGRDPTAVIVKETEQRLVTWLNTPQL